MKARNKVLNKVRVKTNKDITEIVDIKSVE